MAAFIDGEARLWRNDTDGQPQITVTFPDGRQVYLRVRREASKAYWTATALLDETETGNGGTQDGS